MRKLYLDDERFPKSKDWNIVRDFGEFKSWIEENGLPSLVSFDHDLGKNDDGTIKENGVDCARWMCNYCADSGLPLPKYNIHTANSVGHDNILSVLKTFEKIFPNEL